MAIDPNSPSRPAADLDVEPPIIDNELPAYRALQPLAIFSLIAGGFSVLVFTSSYFAILGVLAVFFGVLAQRSIRKLPEIYTGEKMANAGIALGLLFTLSSFTITFVQGWLIEREAEKFAREYMRVLREGSFEQAYLYESPPQVRKETDPIKHAEESRKAARNPGMFEEHTRALSDMKKRLASSPGQTVDFYKIVRQTGQNLEVYANAILVFKGPKSAAFPEETQYAEAVLHGTPVGGGKYEWWVERLAFPVLEKNLGQ